MRPDCLDFLTKRETRRKSHPTGQHSRRACAKTYGSCAVCFRICGGERCLHESNPTSANFRREGTLGPSKTVNLSDLNLSVHAGLGLHRPQRKRQRPDRWRNRPHGIPSPTMHHKMTSAFGDKIPSGDAVSPLNREGILDARIQPFGPPSPGRCHARR